MSAASGAPRNPKRAIIIDPVIDDGEMIREMARANGPYWQPGRMLMSSRSAKQIAEGGDNDDDLGTGMVGPTFRGEWAFGHGLVEGANELLHHRGFIEAASRMYDTDAVVPEQVYVNLSSPMPRQGFSHTDIPEFRGVDRTNAPAWLLTAMGASRLFESERVHIVTAVAWFYRGEAGGLRYWPNGMDQPSLLHDRTWNTAIVGDNDFMPHEVQRIGPRGSAVPAGMTIRSELVYDNNKWRVVDGDKTLAEYDDSQIRLSLSWKAKVFADDHERRLAETGAEGVAIEEAIARLGADLATSDRPEELAGHDVHSNPLRQQFDRRYSTYAISRPPPQN